MKATLTFTAVLMMGFLVCWLRSKAMAERKRNRDKAEKVKFLSEILKK
jgi:hypothetical protein